jgi:hypothetical protein
MDSVNLALLALAAKLVPPWTVMAIFFIRDQLRDASRRRSGIPR